MPRSNTAQKLLEVVNHSYSERQLKEETPHIVVGTPGRVLALARNGALDLSNLKHFVLDECDQMPEKEGADFNLPPVRAQTATAFCNTGMHHTRRGSHARRLALQTCELMCSRSS